MAYCYTNYPTKKALKADVAAGKKVGVYQPGPFGEKVPDGTCYLEGPHYPKPHTWYASATVRDNYIVGKVS